MVTIYQHGFLIDGLADSALDDGLVVYEGTKILYAGPYRPEIAAKYPDAQLNDCQG